MAELYGVSPDQVLPTRGATHAVELVLRAARLQGLTTVSGAFRHLDTLAAIYGLQRVESGGDIRVSTAEEGDAAFLVVDESVQEFGEALSRAAETIQRPALVVLRSLSLAYGLAGARCGAAVAAPETIARLKAVLEPYALPTSTVEAAEAALSPSRLLLADRRLRLLREERARVAAAVGGREGAGPWVEFPGADAAALARYGLQAEPTTEGLRLPIGAPEANDRILAAFGVAPPLTVRRIGQAVRDTKETRIVATVDLHRAGETRVRTGVGFFDHMLEQVAAHGGFSLTLACEGDLHTDPHHTVEDSALAFGAALKQALGDRAGIGRFGFVAPMDEAEAAVSLDLSGRPYSVFEGEFRAERIGDYPTALTSHVFRSLADSLGAAIHVRVTGSDDHHKTEVCFKAFGRALRQAVRIEGGGVPSTKGVL